MEGGYSRVVSVSMPEHIASHPSPSTPTSHHTYKEEGRGEEPQDLTPMQDVSNTQVSSHSSPDTPGKKERNSRKQCPYCNKDFHEMSLKRHIKDVHFKNQNTYVICPQCCKQYASQNSLYSHLNRVHGVKKDEIQLQMTGAVMDRGDSNHSDAKYETMEGHHELLVRGGHEHERGIIVRHTVQQDGLRVIHGQPNENNHEGIMDLAQHR